MDIGGKKVLVLGAGGSGMSAARYLRGHGAIVGIYDDAFTKGDIEKTSPYAIAVKTEQQITAEKFDFAVISPGVSINNRAARLFGGRVISELALGFQDKHKKIIAVTGTNGKTGVTNMLGAALGGRAIVCGNIGIPVTSVAAEAARKTAVTEVSSFMLEPAAAKEADEEMYNVQCALYNECKIKPFRPDIALILNITQDHLERHKTMEEYIRCKAAIAENQGRGDVLILNYDDANCQKIRQKRNEANESAIGKNKKRFDEGMLFFSLTTPVRGIYLDGKNVVLNIKNRPQILFDMYDFGDDKAHSVQNFLAVTLAAKLAGADNASILAACRGSISREHRIQYIARVGSVAFYNDSKATNIAATLAAVRSFAAPTNLLLGGQVKGQDFAELFEKLPPNVEHIFCFGWGANTIIKAAGDAGYRAITKCADMQEATHRAFRQGFGPRVVLLSPACASLDQFTDYAERGRKFAEIVMEIVAEEVGEIPHDSPQDSPSDIVGLTHDSPPDAADPSGVGSEARP
jgi:UDP-N-acetylmuramoylalanine--D-glutamate ligase